MRCPLCHLDNDPALRHCARCNAALADAAPAPAPRPEPEYRPDVAPGPAPAGLVPAPVDGATRRNSLIWPLVTLLAVVIAAATTVLVTRGLGADTPDAQPGGPPTTVAPTDAPAGPTSAPGPDPTIPDLTADPRAQASAVDDLLDDSGASRGKLNQAIGRVQGCSGLDGALAAMHEVGDERREQIARSDALRLDALPDGERIRSALRTALGHSLAADEHFVRWATSVRDGGCGGSAPLTADYRAAQDDSEAAGIAKRGLLTVWNRVASQFGLPTRTRENI